MSQHPRGRPERRREWSVVDAQRQAELERVLSLYRLGRLRGAERPEHGFVNDNWIVDTTRGRFFLKHRHPALSEPAFVRAQHALTIWLRSGGFPAPELKRTLRGETLCVLDNECYEIQEHIAGTHYDQERAAHLEEAATTLARYHTIVSSFALAELCRSRDLYEPRQVSENLAHLVQTWQATTDMGLADLVACIERQARDLAARFAEHRALPGLVIHGDYYAGNLLFAGDRIVGVVDYDKARWQARVVELAEALIYFASPRPGQLQHLVYAGYPEWSQLRRFLQAYCHIAPLVDAEAKAVPDYVQCIWLQMSLCRLRDKAERPPEAREALAEVFALGHWAQEHRAAMAEACQSASRPHHAAAPR
jgi:homoserine kinase type II